MYYLSRNFLAPLRYGKKSVDEIRANSIISVEKLKKNIAKSLGCFYFRLISRSLFYASCRTLGAPAGRIKKWSAKKPKFLETQTRVQESFFPSVNGCRQNYFASTADENVNFVNNSKFFFKLNFVNLRLLVWKKFFKHRFARSAKNFSSKNF